MTARLLYRCCGMLAFGVAALLLFLGGLPLFLLPAGEVPLGWVLHPAWSLLSELAFVLAVLEPLVLVSLYAFQAHQAGILGLAGFAMAFVGHLLYASFQFDMAVVWPVLAVHAPSLVSFDGAMFQNPMFAFAHSWMGPIHSLGILLFGVATYRAGVYPRWSAVLFTVGMVLSAGILFPPLALRAVGAPLAALALLLMGVVLWRSGTAAPELAPESRTDGPEPGFGG